MRNGPRGETATSLYRDTRECQQYCASVLRPLLGRAPSEEELATAQHNVYVFSQGHASDWYPLRLIRTDLDPGSGAFRAAAKAALWEMWSAESTDRRNVQTMLRPPNFQREDPIITVASVEAALNRLPPVRDAHELETALRQRKCVVSALRDLVIGDIRNSASPDQPRDSKHVALADLLEARLNAVAQKCGVVDAYFDRYNQDQHQRRTQPLLSLAEPELAAPASFISRCKTFSELAWLMQGELERSAVVPSAKAQRRGLSGGR